MLGELTSEQINDVLFSEVQLLVARLMPLVTSETLRLPDDPFLAAARPVTDAPETTIYRIRLTERTGRFEKR